MTIPDEAVQAAMVPLQNKTLLIPFHVVKDALTAALPFLQGVKVKELDWKQADTDYWRAISDYGCYGINEMKEGCFEMDGDNYDTLEAAKAAAQADYEARILSAIEVSATAANGRYEARICKDIPTDCCDYGVVDISTGIEVCRVWKEEDARRIAELLNGYPAPSPRAQALEEGDNLCSRLEGLASWLDGSQHSKWCGRKEVPIHGFSGEGKLVRSAIAAIRALSSQPVADGWLPIETCPPEHVLFFGMDRHGDKVAVEGFKAVNGTLCVGNKDLKPFTFTHWRPLPASPGASE